MTGAEVVALRKALSLSQKDLAARLDVEVAVVRAWEAGTMFPTLKHVTMLERIRSNHRGTENGRSEENENSVRKEDDNAEFMSALRKALGNPELRAEIVRIAAKFKDTGEK